MSQKITSRNERVKRMEKRMIELNKIKDSLSTAEAESDRKVTESTVNMSPRNEEMDMDRKLE